MLRINCCKAVIVFYPSKFIWIFLLRIICFRLAYLIIPNALVFIYMLRAHSVKPHVIFCPSNEKGFFD